MNLEKEKRRGFFKKPEGKTGLLFMAGLIIGGGLLAWKFLPFIIGLFSNLITAGLMVIGIGAVLWIATRKQTRNLAWFGFKMIMKRVTSWFVKIDPIAIIETYIEDLKKSLQQMDENIVKLRTQMVSLKRIIDSNNDEIEESMKIMQAAQKKGNRDEFRLKSRKAGRTKDSNVKLTEMYNKMFKLYKALTRMYEVSGYVVEDLEDDMKNKKIEHKALKAGHSAMKSGIRAMMGDPDKRAIFEQTLESMEEDAAKKIGEMERFMEMSTSFINNIDLKNGIYEEEGYAMLEEWEKSGFDIMMGDFDTQQKASKSGQKALESGETKEVEKELELVAVERDSGSSEAPKKWGDMF